MATHDYVIANGTGAAVRSDLNNALAAIVSNNSSSSEPSTTYAYQWWADTNGNLLKIRNSANNGWITLRELDGTMLIEDGSASTPGLAFADDVNTGIFSPAADVTGFATGGAERMRISGIGYLLFGQSTSNSPGYGDTTVGISMLPDGRIFSSTAGTFSQFNRNSDGDVISFARSSTGVGQISVDSSSTTYATSSDYRLKENVVALDGAITRVKQLAPRRFNFIVDPATTVDGFLAHEAQTVVPEAVTGTHNEVDDNGNAVMQGIDQSKLVPLLTAALQEAISKIETLETKVAALEAA